ncbi:MULTISPECIES: hypothetical protein [unclassified Bradyrhizobium]|uniref:hypothetical protein n=1 Tax=unclassified Bradyrhizobium TaxID=2631580 RepID=UPI00291662C7|nr:MULTISPECIES: hypothetical protein [unclassified Bradyrhizobium]
MQIAADAVVFLEGTLSGGRTGSFKAPDGGKEEPFGMIQMVGYDGTSVRTYEISLAEGFDMKRYPVGTKMKIPVRVGASKDGKRIYYREVPPPPADGNAKQTTTPRADDALRTAAKL